jgi:hypothetical protein
MYFNISQTSFRYYNTISCLPLTGKYFQWAISRPLEVSLLPTALLHIAERKGLVVNPDLAVCRVTLWDPEEDVCEL